VTARQPASQSPDPEPGPRAPSPDAIDVRHLTRRFGSFVAVDDVSFSVPQGEVFGFLGANGAGKSTTIRMLTGLLRPTAGRVEIEGLDLATNLLAIKSVIGVLPEELPLYERLSGEDAREGFVLDGFPRTMAQADALEETLREIGRDLDVVFEFQIPDEVGRERMLKRAAEEGRTDDTPEAIDERLRLYHEETKPLIEYYRTRGNLVGVHGDRPVNQVFSEIQQTLEQVAVR